MEVTIPLEEYNRLLKIEMDNEMKVNHAHYLEGQVKKKIENLYTIETQASRNNPKVDMYVQIDKVNLMGLLNLSIPKDEVDRVFFEFNDRSVFLNESRYF